MANIKFSNFAQSQLAVGIGVGTTTIALVGGHGSRFPALTGAEYFYATIENASTQREIVRVTARSGDTLTVVRGQDGTTARAWNAGDSISLRLNAAAIEDVLDNAVIPDGGVTEQKLSDSAVTTQKIADKAVSLAKIQDINTMRLLGRTTAGTGPTEELQIGSGIQVAGGVISVQTVSPAGSDLYLFSNFI